MFYYVTVNHHSTITQATIQTVCALAKKGTMNKKTTTFIYLFFKSRIIFSEIFKRSF